MNTLTKLCAVIISLLINIAVFADCNDYVPNQVLIKFKENQKTTNKVPLKTQTNANTLKIFPKLNVELWEFSGSNKKMDVKAIVEQFKNHPDIEYIEPNYIYHIPEVVIDDNPIPNNKSSKRSAYVPNDPEFINQWYLNNPPDGVDINAPEAWDTWEISESPSVKVAILDSGIDWTHEDLANNIWQNLGEDADGDGVVLIYENGNWIFDPDDENGIDDDNNGYIDDFIGWDFLNNDNNPMDDLGSGTMVAGIIGAVGDNNIGIAGITWNEEMAALKLFGPQGAVSCSGITEAVNYSVEMGFPISNNSWGGGNCDNGSRTLYDAIEYAQNNDQLFIAAAGNNNSDNDQFAYYPASYDFDNIIAVAAIANSEQLMTSSNYGANSVDIAAPGQTIRTTFIGNSYNNFFQTSAATPQVTGACVLIKQLRPDFSASQIKNILLSSVVVTPLLFDKVSSNGRLDLLAALSQDLQLPNDITDVYPGDLNHDGIVDKVDFCLSGAILYELGPGRSNEHQNIDWYAHPAENWGRIHIYNQDYKHFDCNGDGVINQNDHQAIEDNMGEMWTPTPPEPQPAVTNVFPGDLNHDGIVNNQDIGLIGLYLFEVGPPRVTKHQNTSWYAHPAEDWNRQQINSHDIKHFDCNGDGLIDDNDAQAVYDNFGLTWTTETEYQVVLSPVEEISENYLRIQVALENTNGNDLDLRGGYFTIGYSQQSQNISNVIFNFSPFSWIGIPNLNLNTYSENFPAAQTIEAAFSRNDGMEATGSGVIGDLILQIDNGTARTASESNCMLNIEVRNIGMLDNEPVFQPVENRMLEINMCEDVCEDDWYIDNNTQFQNVYMCSDSIITNGFVMVSDSQYVKYQANHIQLNSGFKVKAGANFKAEMQPCE